MDAERPFANARSAQKFLGHSYIQVTRKIYTHLSAGKEQAAVDALNKYFDGDEKIAGRIENNGRVMYFILPFSSFEPWTCQLRPDVSTHILEHFRQQ